MRPSSLLTAVAVAVLSTAVVAARPIESPAVAETYFGCLPGYLFQSAGSYARCYKQGTITTADIICGIGQVKALDQFNGGKDGCQMKTNNVVGNYTCPSGFSPKVQAGPDMCEKFGSPSVVAPSVAKLL